MSDQMAPLSPSIVPCCQYPIMAAQLLDDRIIATLQSFCDALQLDYLGQVQRIRRQPILAEQFLVVPLITETGWQLAEVLTTVAIPLWLAGIQLTRLAPEKRALTLAFQREAVDTLYRYFYKRDAKQASQSTTTHSEPPRSALEMHIEAWQETEREWDAKEARYEARIATLERQQAQMAARLASLEQQRDGGARGEEPPSQSGPILSQAHIGQVYALAHHQRRQTGEQIRDMLQDLADTFDVPDMSDIPDEGWDHVLRWFWSRTQR